MVIGYQPQDIVAPATSRPSRRVCGHRRKLCLCSHGPSSAGLLSAVNALEVAEVPRDPAVTDAAELIRAVRRFTLDQVKTLVETVAAPLRPLCGGGFPHLSLDVRV
jgi:hypothetical protein